MQSWDDLGTDNRTVYYIQGNTVVIRHYGGETGQTQISDGTAQPQFRVYGWRTIGTSAP